MNDDYGKNISALSRDNPLLAPESKSERQVEVAVLNGRGLTLFNGDAVDHEADRIISRTVRWNKTWQRRLDRPLVGRVSADDSKRCRSVSRIRQSVMEQVPIAIGPIKLDTLSRANGHVLNSDVRRR